MNTPMVLTASPPGHVVVHVWMATLCCTDEERRPFWELLSEDERERASRFRFPEHRNSFIVARAKTRSILAGYLTKRPGEIRFIAHPGGKPALAGNEFQFNVSHSGSMLACAVTQTVPVGIDIEQIGDTDVAPLVESFFAPEEQREVLEHKSLSIERFFRCWTRKEAFLKATGEGLFRALNSFAVTTTSDVEARFIRIDREDRSALWRLLPVRVPAQYKGAVAVRACVDELRVSSFD